MKKLVNYCSIIFLLLVATSQVKAQSVDVVIRENGTERKESIDLPKSMTYPLDSLLNDWKAKNYIDLGKDCSTAEINPLFSDSVYIDRLSRIPAIMEMPYNDIIRKFHQIVTIEQYRNEEPRKNYIEVFMERQLLYKEKVFDYLLQKGVLKGHSARVMALEFFAPFFLLQYRYGEDREKLTSELKEHAVTFIKEHLKED